MMAAAVYRKGGFYPADAFGVAVVSGIVGVIALVRYKDRTSAAVAFVVGGLALWWMIRSVVAHRPAASSPRSRALRVPGRLCSGQSPERSRPRARRTGGGGRLGRHGRGRADRRVLAHPSAGPAHGGFWQLSTPLTDPAGAAGMFAVALLLALGLDLDVPVVRVALCLMLAALIGTQSHWVLLALACGAFFVPLGRWRRAGWPLAMGLVAGVVVLASASSHLGSWPAALALGAAAAASALRLGASPAHSRPRVGAAVVLMILVAGGRRSRLCTPRASPAPAEPVDQGQTLAWSAAARAWGSSVVTGTGPRPSRRRPGRSISAVGLNPDTVLTIGTDGGIIAVVLLVGAVGIVGAACRRRSPGVLCGGSGRGIVVAAWSTSTGSCPPWSPRRMRRRPGDDTPLPATEVAPASRHTFAAAGHHRPRRPGPRGHGADSRR